MRKEQSADLNDMKHAQLNTLDCHSGVCPPTGHSPDEIFAYQGLTIPCLIRWSMLLQVCYPKKTDKKLFCDLVTQCQSLGIAFVAPEDLTPGKLNAAVVLDALFGFSFKVGTDPFNT